MPQTTTATLPIAYPATSQLQIDTTGMDILSISQVYNAAAGSVGGKARIKAILYSKGVTAGVEEWYSHGQEAELQDDGTGLITLENFLKYDTETAVAGSSTPAQPMWGERVVSTYDRVDLYAYEIGDAAHPGTLTLTYSGVGFGG